MAPAWTPVPFAAAMLVLEEGRKAVLRRQIARLAR